MPGKYRSRLEDRMVSYANALLEDVQENERFGLAAQLVAKQALQFAGAASSLVDACLLAAAAPTDEPLDGATCRRIEHVYSTAADTIRENTEYELAQLLELLAVLGIESTTDTTHPRQMEKWAAGLGLSTEALQNSKDDDDESEKPAANAAKRGRAR
jgi:hypothetical protein